MYFLENCWLWTSMTMINCKAFKICNQHSTVVLVPLAVVVLMFHLNCPFKRTPMRFWLPLFWHRLWDFAYSVHPSKFNNLSPNNYFLTRCIIHCKWPMKTSSNHTNSSISAIFDRCTDSMDVKKSSQRQYQYIVSGDANRSYATSTICLNDLECVIINIKKSRW